MRSSVILPGLAVSLATGFILLAGCNRSEQRTSSSSGSSVQGTAVRYAVTVDGGGFHPNQLSLAVGVPATLVVTRTTDQTCAKEMVVPSMNLRKVLPLNQPVELAMTPTKKGQIAFACGMNMMTGVIDVR